jgi:hypothetical protein
MLPSDEPGVWLFYADNSYVASRLLWLVGLELPEGPISAHRTVELYLKAFLVSHGVKIVQGSPAWGHRVAEVRTVCAAIDADFNIEDLQRRIAYFQRYYDFVRYPADDRMPTDGSLIWLTTDAVLYPLDEIVAFVRPRVKLTAEDWAKSYLMSVDHYPHRALHDNNRHIDLILCSETTRTYLSFNPEFNADRPGC